MSVPRSQHGHDHKRVCLTYSLTGCADHQVQGGDMRQLVPTRATKIVGRPHGDNPLL